MRSTIFWLRDWLSGNGIKKHYKEIKFIQNNFSSNKAIALMEKYGEDLLTHAKTTTPFYKHLNSTVSLKDFPVINKSIIRENFEEFKSEKFLNRKLFKVSSSGSTGTPFQVYQDSNKRKRNIADTIYFGETVGFALGTKLIFSRVWTPLNRKSKLVCFMQNLEMQDVLNLNDDEISNFIKYLKSDKDSKSILSYASSLEAICKYLDKTNSAPINSNINVIIANSEKLSEYTKEAIPKYFNTPVISRYSNAENGILSQQSKDGTDDFIINWASYYIEILKFDEDVPAFPGEMGRVVVTDLFNYSMPMIRYDTGDVARMEINSNQFPVFKTVEGRKQDIVYNSKEQLISSFAIGGLMKKYHNIKQFQFIQMGRADYRLKLNPSEDFNNEQELKLGFQNILGHDSNIEVEYIDDIPLLASGKRRQIVNEYHCQ